MTATLPRSRYRRDGGRATIPHTAKVYADLARLIGGTPKSAEHKVDAALAILANLVHAAEKADQIDWLKFKLSKLLLAARAAGHPLQFTTALCAQVNRSDLEQNVALTTYLAEPTAEHRVALRRATVRDIDDNSELVRAIDAAGSPA